MGTSVETAPHHIYWHRVGIQQRRHRIKFETHRPNAKECMCVRVAIVCKSLISNFRLNICNRVIECVFSVS